LIYRGAAEQDVLDVVADVERTYRIDSARIYLMGYSMGGYGTWSIAIDHPESVYLEVPGGSHSDVAAPPSRPCSTSSPGRSAQKLDSPAS
jgi:poly(3-hydroxybutyrate) depolymerase